MIAAGWDCHVHVFGPFERFPLDPARLYTPMAAGVADLTAHLERLNAGRVVVVQPSPYGADHGCLIDALDALGARAFGVAAWRRGAEAPRHKRVTGLRMHTRAAARPAEAIADAARMAADLGLHLEVQLGPGTVEDLADALAAAPCRLALDHLAGLSGMAPQAALDRVARLLERGRTWIKYAAPYRAAGGIERLAAVAHWLHGRFPDRLVWGSDWPHTPAHPPDGEGRLKPSAFRAIDAVSLAERMFAPFDAAARAAIRCDNPARLYAEPAG